MHVSVRPAIGADAGIIASLLADLGYLASPQSIRERLASRRGPGQSSTVVAESGGRVAGFMSAEVVYYFPRDVNLCRITVLVVAPDYRRAGIGKALIDEAAKLAGECGCDGMEITTAEERAGAHRFYERMGFSRTSYRFFRDL